MFEYLVLLYLVLAFAIFRVTYMLCYEEGTFGMFSHLRDFAGVKVETRQRSNVVGQPVDYEVAVADNVIGKVLTCFYCCSIWVSLFPAMLLSSVIGDVLIPFYIWFFVFWFALSGSAILIKENS